jgi:type IV fimbrial biogenesis protein FimT
MMPLQSRGLTLIELMMAIAMAPILLAIAGPSFQQALNGNRLGSAANELTGACNWRAPRRCAPTAARRCAVPPTAAPATAHSTWPGWIVFVDVDGDGVRDSTEPVVKSGRFSNDLVVKSSANIAAVNERSASAPTARPAAPTT